MLTSTRFHARAVVWSDPTMCFAIALRMCETGTTSSPRPAPRRTGGTAAAAAAAADAAGARRGGRRRRRLPAATADPERLFFVIRPPVPVP